MEHISHQQLEALSRQSMDERIDPQVEQHLSGCSECQERLLAAASDVAWRNDFASSCHELSPSELLGLSMTGAESTANPVGATDATGVDVSSINRPASGDQFDLASVPDMLRGMLSAPTHPELLGSLGRYDVEAVIGCGGMGAVVKGFDRDLHRPVAIKFILPRLSGNGTAKKRFAMEARAAAAVIHPNVVGIHGIEETEGIPWFVMPYVPGPSLQQWIDDNGPPSEREIVRIGLQIASGLSAAHHQGLVHRDIKPANVLLDNQVNRVVITDFGLARQESEQSMTQTGALAGTLNYMSPEQSRGEDLDGRSDLFSLGSLLYFLAAGRPPFHAESAFATLHQIGSAAHVDVRKCNPEISETLSAVIDRLLNKHPDQRFQSAAELEGFLADLLAHLNQPTQHARPHIHAGESKQITERVLPLRKLGVLAAAVGIGALLVSLPGWFDANKPNSSDSNVELAESITMQWRAIAKRYELDSPAEFANAIVQLREQISVAEMASEQRDTLSGSETLSAELMQLNAEMQSLDSALDQSFMPSSQ